MTTKQKTLQACRAAKAARHGRGVGRHDKFREECGVFGIFGHPEAANLTYLGLYALQHRGQESAGIAASDGGDVRISKSMGYVADAFSEKTLEKLPGHIAIGHVRYSTAGDSKLDNAQPILIDCAHGQIAIGHNGNLVNASELKDELVQRGSIFQTSTDTEVILHLYARSRAASSDEAIVEAHFTRAGRVFAGADDEGSADCGARSARLSSAGDRPPGRRRDCVLRNMRARFDRRDLRSRRRARRDRHRQRVGREVVQAVSAGAVRALHLRARLFRAARQLRLRGERQRNPDRASDALLAREQPADADVIVPVPDSGVCAAIGFAEESGIPMRVGLIRNHYVGRTFIEPQQAIRHFGVRVKLNPVRSILEGRRVVLVDDSLVRGTTSRKIVKMVKAAGAKEVHMRISCPPTISPCFYGVDTPRRSELIAATHTLEEIQKYIGADSVGLSEPRRAAVVGRHATARRTARRATPDSILLRFRAMRPRICSWRSSSIQMLSRHSAASVAPRWRSLLCRAAVRAARPAQERGPQPLSADAIRSSIDALGNLDFPVRMKAVARAAARSGRGCGSGADQGGRRPQGSVREIPGARAADRIQRRVEPPTLSGRSPQSQRSAAHGRVHVLRAPSVGEHDSRAAGGARARGKRVCAPGADSRAGSPGSDPRVRETLLVEVGRGQDFFRSAVIEALGDYRATYAIEPLMASRA